MMFHFGRHLQSIYCPLDPVLGPKDTEMTKAKALHSRSWQPVRRLRQVYK